MFTCDYDISLHWLLGCPLWTSQTQGELEGESDFPNDFSRAYFFVANGIPFMPHESWLFPALKNSVVAEQKLPVYFYIINRSLDRYNVVLSYSEGGINSRLFFDNWLSREDPWGDTILNRWIVLTNRQQTNYYFWRTVSRDGWNWKFKVALTLKSIKTHHMTRTVNEGVSGCVVIPSLLLKCVEESQ